MHSENAYMCPVCGFAALDEPPYDEHGYPTYTICPSCGTEFGYDDATTTHAQLRRKWIDGGMCWWSKTRPAPLGWDAERQIREVSGTTTRGSI